MKCVNKLISLTHFKFIFKKFVQYYDFNFDFLLSSVNCLMFYNQYFILLFPVEFVQLCSVFSYTYSRHCNEPQRDYQHVVS